METEVTEQQEQLMADVLPALAKLVDAMMNDLPESSQGHVVDLLSKGARLGITTVLIPGPTFKLVLVPPNPQDPLCELAWCSPSADTVRALQREAMSH